MPDNGVLGINALGDFILGDVAPKPPLLKHDTKLWYENVSANAMQQYVRFLNYFRR